MRALALLLMLLLKLGEAGTPSHRVLPREAALAVMLSTLLALSVGCGGGSGRGGGTTPAPAKNGTVTVQGTGPCSNHNVIITVNVT